MLPCVLVCLRLLRLCGPDLEAFALEELPALPAAAALAFPASLVLFLGRSGLSESEKT